MRSVLVDLPPGFAGDPFAVDRCTRQEFEGFNPACSPNTQVGILSADLPGIGITATGPIYNMVPPPGVAAQFGFSVAGLNALQELSVRTEAPNPLERYGLLDATYGLPLEATSVEATIWGTPAESGHDSERGARPPKARRPGNLLHRPPQSLPHPAGGVLAPDQGDRVEVDSKLDPGHYVSAEAQSLDPGGNPAAPQGCASVPFAPQVAAATPPRRHPPPRASTSN